MIIPIGCDHAGFKTKELIIKHLTNKGLDIKDFGCFSEESIDYPDFAHPVASAVEKGEADFGVLVCGSAQGVAITANKHQGIRAAVAWLTDIAKLSRQHNNANVICIPARFVAPELAKEMVTTFLATTFEVGRHANRGNTISC